MKVTVQVLDRPTRTIAVRVGNGTSTPVDLSNYYTKSQTYSKAEVDDLIDQLETLNPANYYDKDQVDALIQSVQPSTGSSDVLILDLGATASGNVYNTWASLFTAFGTKKGIVRIQIMDNGTDLPLTLSGTAAYDFAYRAVLMGVGPVPARINITGNITFRNLLWYDNIQVVPGTSTFLKLEYDAPSPVVRVKDSNLDRPIIRNAAEFQLDKTVWNLRHDTSEVIDVTGNYDFYCTNYSRMNVASGEIAGTQGAIRIFYENTTKFNGAYSPTAFSNIITAVRTVTLEAAGS